MLMMVVKNDLPLKFSSDVLNFLFLKYKLLPKRTLS